MLRLNVSYIYIMLKNRYVAKIVKLDHAGHGKALIQRLPSLQEYDISQESSSPFRITEAMPSQKRQVEVISANNN